MALTILQRALHLGIMGHVHPQVSVSSPDLSICLSVCLSEYGMSVTEFVSNNLQVDDMAHICVAATPPGGLGCCMQTLAVGIQQEMVVAVVSRYRAK